MLVVCKKSFEGVFVSKASTSQVIVINSPQSATHATYPWMTFDEGAQKVQDDLELRSRFMATRTLTGVDSEEKGGLNLELVDLRATRVVFEQ